MTLRIRPCRPCDLPALSDICLRTGAGGDDATALYRDRTLLAQCFVAPYVRFEPRLCLVLADDAGSPCGYVLGTRDSAAFAAWCETAWWPALRRRHPLPQPGDDSADARITRLIHAGWTVPDAARDHPAHLHIDLLPAARGQGWGRALLTRFLTALRAAGVPGVHVQTGAANTRAIGLYERLGFARQAPAGMPAASVLYARRLQGRAGPGR